MSTNTEKIKEIQRIIGTDPDGVWGQKSRAAFEALFTTESHNPETGNPVDSRSESNISTLLPQVQEPMRNLVRKAAEAGIQIRLTSGNRTYAEQDALYAQGRTKPGKVVTNARGGYSSHNFGLAADFTIFDGNSPVWESPNYTKVGKIAESLGLSWGGRWSTPDEPHVYLKPEWAKNMSESQMMTELRARHDSGRPVFV